MSSEVKPGMLVEYTTDEGAVSWVTTREGGWGETQTELPGIGWMDSGRQVYRGNPHVYVAETGTAKPLAPAVTCGGLFEALLQVPGASYGVADQIGTPDKSTIFIELETGDVQIGFYAGSLVIAFNPRGVDRYFDLADPRPDYADWQVTDYEARGRDWQKEGAIRAYAAQPGWGGGE